jgi:hypothetical protein
LTPLPSWSTIDQPATGAEGEKKPRRAGLVTSAVALLHALDVGSLLAFRALRDFELDFLTFFEGLKTVHVDCGEVCEQIFAAVIWSDEAKAFGIIEPLNSTSCHKELSNKNKITRAIKARSFLPPPQSAHFLSTSTQVTVDVCIVGVINNEVKRF